MRFAHALRPFAVGFALLLGLLPACAAQDYPVRRITFIVAFAPGGVADTLARVVAHGLESKLHQSVVVENHSGAGGNVGAGLVSRAAPDGYTFLVTTTGLAINVTLNKSSPFKAADFKTVAMVASSPEALVVNPANPAKTLAEFVKAHKDKPFNFGSAGVGSGSHVEAAYFFNKIAGIKGVHVPYQGGAPAMNAALANQIDVLAITLGGGAANQIKAGKLRGLGVAGEKRAAVAPDVPTYAESGFPGFSAASWVAVFAPAKTDPAEIETVNKAIEEVMNDPAVQKRLTSIGFDPMHGSAAEAQAYFNSEVKKWGEMVHALGLSIN